MPEQRDLFQDEQETRKLVLLDGMALVYRAHFALIRSPRYTSRGKCTSAIFGFCNTLIDLVKREHPSHLAVAFDTSEPTHRHEMYAEYKAQREEMPEELAEQIPDVFRLLEAFRIPILRLPGWEADDVLGTLARKAEKVGFETTLVTPDKDYHQLVTPHVEVWKPGRQGSQFERLGIAQVKDRWQVNTVAQVIDILGLMGDTSDNVPGIPGIGEKTAQKLIAEFGSIENLLANTAQLKGKRRELVETYAEQALLSKQLVTIDTAAPIDVDWKDLEYTQWDEPTLRALFQELEFSTLSKRILPAESTAPVDGTAAAEEQQPTANRSGMLFDEDETDCQRITDVKHEYTVVDSDEKLQKLLDELRDVTAVCFDLETTGLDARDVRILGAAISFQRGRAYYVVMPSDEEGYREMLDKLTAVFNRPGLELVGHNLKYDLTVLRWHNLPYQGPMFDTMLAHTILEPELKHGMDFLAEELLNYKPIPITDLLGDPQTREMHEVPLAQLAEYAAEDADVTWQLKEKIQPLLVEQKLDDLCARVEFPLIEVLVDMEREGIRIDVEALQRYSNTLADEIETLQQAIFAAAGHSFNVDSPKQLGQVLFDELKLVDKPGKTATGQYSTREADLLKMVNLHPIVRDVLEYRNAVKLKSVYVDQLPQAVNPRTGRIHTTYSQAWTATGRMQSNAPNLQTIPVRKERGREIRAAFIARDSDHWLLSADYSQIELRIMAALSGDEGMIDAFRNEIDIHAVTAAKVYKVPLDQVTREMRDKAKTVNFGIIYGISAFGLQQRLNIPRDEANSLIKNYFEEYPGVRAYIDRTIQFGRDHGYVQTQLGRRRPLRDINSKNGSLRGAAERLAMNSPIQGTAADMLKLAMIRVHGLLTEHQFETKMLLTVHDEIVFDLKKSEREAVLPLIRDAMQNALPLDVPIVVEMGWGDNWLEAH
ncbi:MAG: DNA polymerase I [Planctomycetales bacterium]|nr:DNA polymerase I [Planctomycetales bacterium]